MIVLPIIKVRFTHHLKNYNQNRINDTNWVLLCDLETIWSLFVHCIWVHYKKNRKMQQDIDIWDIRHAGNV